MAALSLQFLGPFEAKLGEIPLTRFRTRTVQALLIYLACQPDQAHRRDGIMAPLWLGIPPEPAQVNMQER